jgi:hypothetical protein
MTEADELGIIPTLWAAGLFAALLITLVDVMLLVRVIRAARKINALAERTLAAAGGIAHNTAAINNLTATNEAAGGLLNNAVPLVEAAAALESKLATVAAFLGRR